MTLQTERPTIKKKEKSVLSFIDPASATQSSSVDDAIDSYVYPIRFDHVSALCKLPLPPPKLPIALWLALLCPLTDLHSHD